MQQKKNVFPHLIEFYTATLLISTSGPLGRYINLPPPLTIFWRTVLAAIFLYIFCRWKKYSLIITNRRDFGKIILAGILFGTHWVTYFYALQLSNVAIGMLSIYTYPVITSFLEPLILKTRFKLYHLGLGLLVLLGIYLLVPDFSFENKYTKAVAFGVFSAFCYALRNIMMKPQVAKYNGSSLMFYQILTISILLSPMLFKHGSSGFLEQWKPLVVLALFTTSIGHTLFLMSFRRFSITTASIMNSAQPVFGIIIGMLFLKEYPSLLTVFGGILILAAVIIENIVSLKD
ncbi:DMT family transporter [Abyssalbus ytuae]|uniref:DMT family transporter n=1 Tax=Abyssalbus ytuae TaxID=2926907 RepID=A0A9E6ZV08_9FLAO|nr:DMT family transporter [Abyssalbus ytuae]UOB17296.1 DMT family transporter [Abyssalbus ytuae]